MSGNWKMLSSAPFVLCDGDELTVAEFPQIAAQVDGFDVRIPPIERAAVDGPVRIEKEIVRVEMRDPNAAPLLNDSGEMRSLQTLEEEIIRFALKFYRSNMTEVARRLGIGRSTLYRKLKEYGLDEGLSEANDAA